MNLGKAALASSDPREWDDLDQGNLTRLVPEEMPGGANTSTFRIVCKLSVLGHSLEEIAETLGITIEEAYEQLNSVKSQKLLTRMIEETDGTNEIANLLKGGAALAVMELRKLVMEAKTEGVRLNAIKTLLTMVFEPDKLRAPKSDSVKDLLEEIQKQKKAS
jgi:hypothetical protein